jgi:hypothetical protein
VAARNSSAVSPSFSTDNVAQPIDPSPPALLTAAARAGVVEPAMGAWIMGLSMPRRSSRSVRGHMAASFAILLTIADMC